MSKRKIMKTEKEIRKKIKRFKADNPALKRWYMDTPYEIRTVAKDPEAGVSKLDAAYLKNLADDLENLDLG